MLNRIPGVSSLAEVNFFLNIAWHRDNAKLEFSQPGFRVPQLEDHRAASVERCLHPTRGEKRRSWLHVDRVRFAGLPAHVWLYKKMKHLGVD